ncbi:MAG: hypothetical protein WCA10_02735 [Terracidiphilus sp.]
MRFVCAVAGAALFACNLAGLAETKVSCDQTLTAPLRSSAVLTIDSRPAGLEIVGTDQEAIHVTCHSGDNEDAPRHILLRFSPSSDGGRLSIEGNHLRHGDGIQIRIEVPWKTNLSVRMPAGEVKVEEIKGDKDIDIYAGQITISSFHEWNYRNVNASVMIGEVRAPMYNADKGGFFRSITKKSTEGEYRLHAHIMTGQIDLEGSKNRSDGTRQPD